MAAQTSPLTNWLLGIFSMVIAAGIGFLGVKALETNDKVTTISTELPALKVDVAEVKDELSRQVQDIKAEVKTQVTGLVSRPELEARIAETKVETGQLRVEQQKISLEIYKLSTEAALDRRRESHERP